MIKYCYNRLAIVDQHGNERAFSEDMPSLRIVVQDVEIMKQDLLNWLFERVVSKYQCALPAWLFAHLWLEMVSSLLMLLTFCRPSWSKSEG